jgi:hypothetical protein
MFPENRAFLSQKRSGLLHVPPVNPFYHGPNRAECLLVKFRREQTYDGHFLDIWKCLEHNKETCRCGMEWDYYLGGHYIPKVKPKRK